MTIGERIQARRSELGISSNQVQQQTGISTGNLSAIENGKVLPSAKALIALSGILDCSIDWILTGNSNIGANETLTPEEAEFLLTFRGIEPYDQEEILTLLRMKRNRIENCDTTVFRKD